MSKYKKVQPLSAETFDTAMAIAKGIKKPNQTKEQTKLIAQGIQKGISEYKKQQKAKARELDKLKKKLTHQQYDNSSNEASIEEVINCKYRWLPWSLLVISWLAMAIFTMGE